MSESVSKGDVVYVAGDSEALFDVCHKCILCT
mgnify:FL=1